MSPGTYTGLYGLGGAGQGTAEEGTALEKVDWAKHQY